MKNFKNLLSLPLLTGMLSPVAAHAFQTEGGDVFINAVAGTIRIVLSKPGHLQTEGDVSVGFYQPLNAGGVYDREVNPFNNKPSPYLGGAVLGLDNLPYEFDAGVQFESGVISRPIGRIGFVAFISRGPNTYVNLRLWNGDTVHYEEPGNSDNPNPHRGYSIVGGTLKGEMTTVRDSGADLSNGNYSGHLSFKIEPATAARPGVAANTGGVCLSVSNFESTVGGIAAPAEFFYWNQQTDPLIDPAVKTGYELDIRNPDTSKRSNPLTDPADPTGKTLLPPHNIAPWRADANFHLDANQSAARVKHEFAMTRNVPANNFKLDGSQTIITWRDCYIDGAPWDQTKTELSYPTNIKGVHTKSTGYNAPGNSKGNSAYDRRIGNKKSALSHTIVEFSTVPKDNLDLRQGVVNGARYANETVTINLKTATELQGQPLEWAKP